MNQQNENKGGLITTEKGAVWNIKVRVSTIIGDSFQLGKLETKHWEIKVILN